MWASKSYVSTAFKSTCSYKNELGGREIEIAEGVCHFNTVRDAPAGSPFSRVSPIILIPSHIRPTLPTPSKRSPHPSRRGGARKPEEFAQMNKKSPIWVEKHVKNSKKISSLTNSFFDILQRGWASEGWWWWWWWWFEIEINTHQHC